MSSLPNGQRKLVFTYQYLNAFSRFIKIESLQFCRRQCVRDEILYVRIPADNIHLFVVQLAHDIFDPLSPQAHASAHRIDLLVARPHRQLGSKTRLAGNPLDFNGAIIDFGHFQLEKLNHKMRVGPGENNLGPMRAVFDGFDITPDAFADLIFLGGHPLPIGEQSFIFA